MAYPIRFRLIDRQTGKEFKGKDSRGNPHSAILFPSGQPAIMERDFYTYVSQASCKDYVLQVATEKDEKGNWVYKQCGD